MKKICLMFLLAFSLSAVSAQAALPPLYESIKEYKALLDDPRFADSFSSGESILSIDKSYNVFIITTNQHVVKVKVVYDDMKQPGPALFHFEFSDPVENNSK